MAKVQSVLDEQAEKETQAPDQIEQAISFNPYANIINYVYGKDAPYVMQVLNSQPDRRIQQSIKNALDRVQSVVTAFQENGKNVSHETVVGVSNTVRSVVQSIVSPAVMYGATLQTANLPDAQKTESIKRSIAMNDERLKKTQKDIDESIKRLDEIDQQIIKSSKGAEKQAIIAIRARIKDLANKGYANTGIISKARVANPPQPPTDATSFLENKVFPITRMYDIPDAVAATQWAVEGGRQLDNEIHNVFGLGPNVKYPSIEKNISDYALTVKNILLNKGYEPEKLKSDPQAFLNALQDPVGKKLAANITSAPRYEGHNTDPYQYVKTAVDTPEYRQYAPVVPQSTPQPTATPTPTPQYHIQRTLAQATPTPAQQKPQATQTKPKSSGNKNTNVVNSVVSAVKSLFGKT